MIKSSANFWGLVAVFLATLQYIPYFRGIFSGRVKPHALTWLVWALPTGIAFFAQLVKGGGAGTWATGYTALLGGVVFVLSLSRGEKRIVLFDWITLLLALLAMVLWAVTKDALVGVILATIASTLGWIPTVRKSIDKPYEESLTSYNISIVKWFCALGALESMTLTTLLYPIASIVLTAAFAALIVTRRTQLNRRSRRGVLA